MTNCRSPQNRCQGPFPVVPPALRLCAAASDIWADKTGECDLEQLYEVNVVHHGNQPPLSRLSSEVQNPHLLFRLLVHHPSGCGPMPLGSHDLCLEGQPKPAAQRRSRQSSCATLMAFFRTSTSPFDTLSAANRTRSQPAGLPLVTRRSNRVTSSRWSGEYIISTRR